MAESATDLDSRPIPRVETGGHSGTILKLAVDPQGKLLLTVSEDKTARLWDAATGRLLHVLRVPIAGGHEGQLSAAALSPNGKIAAVGGYTGSFTDKSIVYFFDTATGRRRSYQSTNSGTAVDNLAFSMDGKALAICLADGGGVRIFDLEHRALVKYEDQLRDQTLGTAFAPNGDLAVTTLDGHLWMFRAAKKYETTSVFLSGGTRPMHVQFSPNGAELAVGFDGTPTFSILDARSLQELFVGKLPVDVGQKGLHVVDWSDDGNYLYAGGETVAGFDAPVFRFSQKGRGTPERVLLSTRRITDIRRLPQGAMAFTSAEPEVGVLESTGRVRWRYRSSALDLRGLTSEFRLSPTGNSLQFGSSDGRSSFAFDIDKPTESVLKRNSASAGLSAAVEKDSSGWNVAVSNDGESVQINGVPIVLDNRERVRVWAVTPDRAGIMLGTSWSLRHYDGGGKLRWLTALTSSVNRIRVSDDGKAVIVALSDGTLRWYRREDGMEYLALLVNRNGEDWIAWIPAGYYMSSPAGDNFIGWHVNRGVDKDPDFYRAVQFERILYRPDIVRAYTDRRGNASIADLVLQKPAFDVANLDSIAPPRVEVAVADILGADGKHAAAFDVHAESHSLPLQRWSLFVNGIPFVANEELKPTEGTTFSRRVPAPLRAGANNVRAESSNGKSLGLTETVIDDAGAVQAAAGTLYVASIGASRFSDPAIHGLQYAASDATEVAALFERIGQNGKFRATKTLVLADTAPQRAARANIINTLGAFLSQARGEDTVIVFLASHGLSDAQGNYYFVPADAADADIKTVLKGGDRAPSLIRWDYFVDQMSDTAGRRLLIVDTCSSGAAGGTFDAHSLAKRSMSSSFALLAASRGSEESQELSSAKHGLFTYGLMEAIRTGYDPNNDGVVSLSEAFEYAFDKVQTLRNKAVGEQTPQLTAPDVLMNMTLAGTSSAGTATASLH